MFQHLNIILLSLSIAISSCSHQAGRNTISVNATPLIILDTDIGGCTDDVFAIEMLYEYQRRNACQLLGIIVDREGEDNAACIDVFNNYFGYPDTPIGLERNGIDSPKVFTDYRYLLHLTDTTGAPLFPCTISDYSTLSDGWQLYRQLLAAQPDHSVTVCAIGFLTSLAHLLESTPDSISPLNGIELVQQKVKCLYIMAGCFTSQDVKEYNLAQGFAFAETVFRLWPNDVDIVFSPIEVGNQVHYTKEQVLNDISWTDIHPVKQIYLKRHPIINVRMWDPMVIINAVEGDDLFQLSSRGTVSLTPDGVTLFYPSANGNCRYQLPGNDKWAKQMSQKIRTANQRH
ncbi:MAG: nucleoside hydrolase [Paludibacteraceae bacterium]|nr:nucleoside hydrolase [Paludibacteraceae bacterium]